MKKNLLSVVFSTSLLFTSHTALAALAEAANLTFEDGIVKCISDAGTPPNGCTYGTELVSGSWFAWDTNGDGIVQTFEKIPVNLDRGILLGLLQDAAGYHVGEQTGSEDTNIDLSWYYFGNTGVHKTPNTAVTVNAGNDGSGNGIAELDFSGWGLGWGNVDFIPLASNPVDFPADTGLATMKCYTTLALRDDGGTPDGSCAEGEYYILDYESHIPLNDPSGLGGVGYSLHLVGYQIAQPQVSVSVNITNGNTQECLTTNGTWVGATSNVTLDPADEIVSISWALDGQSAATGSSFSQFASLGSHEIEVTVATIKGALGTDTQIVVIEDTQPPVVTAQFIDKLAGGQAISAIHAQSNFVGITAEATDVCDSSPSLTDVMYGILSADGGYFASIAFPGGFVIPQSIIDLHVEATDSSGNVSIENIVLNAP